MIVKFTKNLTKERANGVKYSRRFVCLLLSETHLQIFKRKKIMRKLPYILILLLSVLTVFAACEAAKDADSALPTVSEEIKQTAPEEPPADAAGNADVMDDVTEMAGTALTSPGPVPAYVPETDLNGVYLIKDAADMEWLSDFVNNNNSEVGEEFEARLENDIDMSGISGWIPIGAESTNMFRGTFDGAGHTVYGLDIDSPDADYVALFGVLYNGTIKDLKLENSNLRGAKFTAGICASNSGNIIGCRTAADISGSDTVGGICALNNGTVQNCSNDGSISAEANIAGGVCGYSLEGTTVFCVNRGEVVCDQFAGGIVGYDENGTISSCDNYGGVTARSYAGGICGRTESRNIYTYSDGRLVYEENDGSGTIYECTNRGFVSAEFQYAAGISSYSCYYIEHCSNMGVISAPEAVYAAGISAYAERGAVCACTNYGTVCGASAAAGIVGRSNVPVVMCENFENISVSSEDGYHGGICAQATDTIAHCLNAGGFTADREAGAICCVASSDVVFCADIGPANAADGVCGAPFVSSLEEGGAVFDCYGTGYAIEGVSGVSEEAAASGELAYLMQSSLTSDEYLWGQRLGSDAAPSITRSNSLRVYRVNEYASCDTETADTVTSYSNTEADIIPEHNYEDGVCTVCGANEPTADR